MRRTAAKGTGESAILRQLRSSFRKGDILVADSYYCTYWLIAMCLKLGVHLVMKNHHKRDDDPIGAKRLSDTERTVKWLRPARPQWMSKKEYRKTSALVEISCFQRIGYCVRASASMMRWPFRLSNKVDVLSSVSALIDSSHVKISDARRYSNS